MIAALWIAVFVGALVALAYYRAGLTTTTLVVGVLLAGATLTATAWATAAALWLLFVAAAAALNIHVLRRKWITRGALNACQRALPMLSNTERAAIDAGTAWWEAELLSGAPQWRRLERLPGAHLSAEEQAFIDGPLQQLLELCDQYPPPPAHTELAPEVQRFIEAHGFRGMTIPKRQGGLGFSLYTYSCVLARIGSRPAAAGIGRVLAGSSMAGPARLLLIYASPTQKDDYLPRLAAGDASLGFGLTADPAGDAASAIAGRGVVRYGEFEGKRILGMALTWREHGLKLAPTTTALALAFELSDPNNLLAGDARPGVTCALVPANAPGVQFGPPRDAHAPQGQNRPVRGEDVFLPLDCIIGGPPMIGQGWRMIMACRTADRAITAPSSMAGEAIGAVRRSSAYIAIQSPGDQPTGDCENVQNVLARIGARGYACESVRRFTANAIDLGETPAVASAIAERQIASMARQVADDAKELLGAPDRAGRNAQASPANTAVDRAGGQTGGGMRFAQAIIRCHPYLLKEIEAVHSPDCDAALAEFDGLLLAHIGHELTAAARSLVMGITGGRGTATGKRAALAPYYRVMNRYSANLALLADMALAALGDGLERNDCLTAGLTEAWSQLYIASATLDRFAGDGAHAEDLALVQWVCEDAFAAIESSLASVIRELPSRAAAWLAAALVFPLGRRARPPGNALARRVARLLQAPGAHRDRLLPGCYVTDESDEDAALLEGALQAAHDCADDLALLEAAHSRGAITAETLDERIEQGHAARLFDAAAAKRLRRYRTLRTAALARYNNPR